ncbi:MAG: Ig-like domain-containing protein [Oscillospiraceae bacterium]|nr:Ig-like domain-containing protein [Oscillospiraceae bacterium]
MSRIRMVVIIALVVVILLAGCSIEERKNIPDHGHAPPVGLGFDSVKEFHNFLISTRAIANSGIILRNLGASQDQRTAIDILELHYLERHYIPSWLPEGFRLRGSGIGVSASGVGTRNRGVFYFFITDDYDSSHGDEHRIMFSWYTGAISAEAYMDNIIRIFGLRPADGVGGLYYYDYYTYRFVLMRDYRWLQDNYVFRLNIPLRFADEYGEALVNELVMNSALAVELVDGEYYVEPTGIEIVASVLLDIEVGGTLELTANVSPADATLNAVIWSSSDSSVAVVTQEGVVTRVGQGSATITARSLVNSDIRATFELGGGITGGYVGDEDNE